MSILRPFEKDQDEAIPNRNIAPLTAKIDSEEKILYISDLSNKK